MVKINQNKSKWLVNMLAWNSLQLEKKLPLPSHFTAQSKSGVCHFYPLNLLPNNFSCM